MTVWQYAQLRVRHDNRLAAGDDRWTIVWHGPDGTAHGKAGAYDGVVAELNRAGTQGWELVDIAALDAGDSGRFPDQRDWSLTRYTFRRPRDRAAAKSAELIQQAESVRSQPDSASSGISSGLPDDEFASKSEPARLVRLTVFLLWDGNAEGPESGLGACLLVRQEIITAHSEAELAEIELLRARYEHAGISNRGEVLKAATADYAAKQVEGKVNISWWETRENFPLSSAADVLDSCAELMRSLVQRPLGAAAHAAGMAGPAVSILTGITTNAATARLTAPLEKTARMCEVVGVLVGMLTGIHPLVVACGNRLASDLLGEVLAGVFERVLSESESRGQAASDEHGMQATGNVDHQAVESVPSEIDDDEKRDKRIIGTLRAWGDIAPAPDDPDARGDLGPMDAL